MDSILDFLMNKGVDIEYKFCPKCKEYTLHLIKAKENLCINCFYILKLNEKRRVKENGYGKED